MKSAGGVFSGQSGADGSAVPDGAGFAELTGDERLCDVYCGAGTITLMMARHCREALGIEIVPQAIENAKENAVRNGIGN